jgi:hypothetical protein
MSTKNPALIRLVASRYGDMRGLRTIGDAGCVLLPAVCSRVAMWAETRDPIAQAFVLGVFLAYALYLRLWWAHLRARVERSYDERFGRVAPRTVIPTSWTVVSAMLGVVCATILVDARAPAEVPIAIVLLSAAVWPAWIAQRDFPYRAHWVLVTIVAIVAVLQLPALPAARYVWRMQAMFELGAALAIAGLCDHAILVRTLNASRRGGAVGQELTR